MGRHKRPEWEHVIPLKSLGVKGQATCKCKYCPAKFDGGPYRIRGHLLGIKGRGVVCPCEKVPHDVLIVVQRLEDAFQRQKSQRRGEEDAFENEGACDDVCIGNTIDEENVRLSEGMGSAPSIATASASSSRHVKPMGKRKKCEPTLDSRSLEAIWANKTCTEAKNAVRRFFYAEDIPHWKVRSPYFLEMVKAIGKAGPSFIPPTYTQLRGKELIDEVKCIDVQLQGIKDKWKKYGCTIVCDGWSDTRRRPIINFMACSIHGSVFLKSVDTSGEMKSGRFIYEHLKNVIANVGPENVVQVCMDNASNCVAAGEMLEVEWPHIFFTRCACHCLDLLFEDIGKLEWVARIIEQAIKIVSFVTRKESVLALFRKLSNKDLVKPATTRFAYTYIMLSGLLDDRCITGLRKMMIDDRYARMKVSRTVKAEEIYGIIFSTSFWQDARTIVKMLAPILKILRLCDREGATMGLVYELTDRMIEKFENMEGVDEVKLREVKALCLGRWDMLHSPLHCVGCLLHPVWKGHRYEHGQDKELQEGWMNALERYTKGDLDLQGKLLDEMDMYTSESGMFARPIAKDEKRWQEGVKWWEAFGASTPHLQRLALRVLSQGTCASPCERNWSTFSLIHTKRRNRLLPAHTEKLVYIHTNLRLISKFHERGYERMEVTLDALNKEKDVDRLLTLQLQQEQDDIEGDYLCLSSHGDASTSCANVAVDDVDVQEEEEDEEHDDDDDHGDDDHGDDDDDDEEEEE